MLLNNRRILLEWRKALRKRLTPAEAALWNQLKKSQIAGKKFRRQHSIGRFILDFYCPAAMLAIELDGSAHDSAEAQEKDHKRDAYLKSVGITVLRFENKHVFENMEGVLAEIRKGLS